MNYLWFIRLKRTRLSSLDPYASAIWKYRFYFYSASI